MSQRGLTTRTICALVISIGLLAAYFGGARASVSAAQAGTPGRFQLSTVQYGERGHAVAVVLDTATGLVTPYVVGTNLSIDPGSLRLTPFRVAER